MRTTPVRSRLPSVLWRDDLDVEHVQVYELIKG
jgi:hypothetical protein